jgi:hypothetical protein
MGKSNRMKNTRNGKKQDGRFPSREELDMLAESLRTGFGLMKRDPDDKTLPK